MEKIYTLPFFLLLYFPVFSPLISAIFNFPPKNSIYKYCQCNIYIYIYV